jgi:L-rhamnose mutarotase
LPALVEIMGDVMPSNPDNSPVSAGLKEFYLA